MMDPTLTSPPKQMTSQVRVSYTHPPKEDPISLIPSVQPTLKLGIPMKSTMCVSRYVVSLRPPLPHTPLVP